jgi:alanine racemase
MVKTMSEYFSRQPNPGEITRRIEGYPSWLEIDLDRVGHNIEQVRAKTGVEIIPCVKSNAYGHGIVSIVAYMAKMGIESVLVAKLEEALQLREAGLTLDVVSIGPLFTAEQHEVAVEQRITQGIYRLESAEMLNKAATKLGLKAQVWVKVDTGLGRVGVRWDEAAEFIQRVIDLPNLELTGTFSTLSESDELDEVQVERLVEVKRACSKKGIGVGKMSIASSNAVVHKPYSYLDAVRPGLMLMGIYPEAEDEGHGVDLKQSISWKVRIEQVKYVEKGESLTYSRRFIAPKRMKVGTVHVGYYDGYPRGLTKKGKVRIGDEVRDVLGTVSVNHFLVDLTDLEVDVGDTIEAISMEGPNNVMSAATEAEIMTYSLVNALHILTPRVYYKDGKPVALSEPKLVEK